MKHAPAQSTYVNGLTVTVSVLPEGERMDASALKAKLVAVAQGFQADAAD